MPRHARDGFRLPTALGSLTIVMALAVTIRASAQDAAAGKPLFTPIIWGEEPLAVDLTIAVDFEVRVLDESGQPVPNAQVVLATLADRNGVKASLPLDGGNKSDANGNATVKIPKDTERVGLTTVAAGFARRSDDFNTSGSPEIKLERGRVIHVRAIDSEGKVLENAFPRLQDSRILGREFVKQADGTHLSRVVDLKRRWMQVAASVPDQPMWFSGLIDVADERLIDEDGVMELGMRPGVLLEGRLDDSVPRPIKNGFVELMIVQGEDHKIESGGLSWQDTTRINADGTFAFVSVPPGGHAQLFAIGDGFQTKNPTEKELRAYFDEHQAGDEKVIDAALARPDLLPRLVRLDSEHVEVTLPCRPTAGLDVRVIDPSGQPIPGAVGSINPNGLFLAGGLFIPGTERSTRAMVEGARGFAALAGLGGGFAGRSFVSVTADEQGVIRFRNIPSRRESYEVAVDGYVMAAHPTSSSTEEPLRFALVNLKDGVIAKRTLTMERLVPRAQRELTVVYQDGRPLSDMNVTLTELTTSDDKDGGDWHTWSVQRLGPVSRGKTDKEGRVVLWHPAAIDGSPVRSLRFQIQGIPEKRVSCQSYVNVPAERDGRVIKVVPAAAPRSEGAYRTAKAVYQAWQGEDGLSRRQLVDGLVKNPTLIGLRQLLILNGFESAEPLKLLPNRNRTTVDSGSAVERIDTRTGSRVVVLAHVRPKHANWTKRPGGGFPPEAAFVFEGDGKLVNMIGGGTSASGDEESITLANLGGTGDFFARVSAFESHPPHEYYSRWWRIGGPDEPSLTVFHDANSNSWSGINGTSEPISEFGFLGYEFNGQDIDHRLPGKTPEGATVPRRILWDGGRDRFFGSSTQSFEGRPLYQVVGPQSAEFQEVETDLDSIVIAGGRRDFRNWHQWTVTIPIDGTYVAKLITRDADGNVIRLLAKDKLSSGQHSFQLQIAPEGQTDAKSKLVIMLDAADTKDKRTLKIDRVEVDDRRSVEGQAVYFAGPAPVRLFDKPMSDGARSLVWMIEKAN